MMMSPSLRKFALTAHVTTSVGWMGAVASFIALAVAGLVSADGQTVRAVYIAMDVVARFVIVPLCFASVITGIVSSVGTEWGLFKHYWVLVKIVITIPSTIILLVHMQPISAMAQVAAETALGNHDFTRQRMQLMITAGLALIVLMVATVLSVYKPRGMTSYGQRKQNEQRAVSLKVSTK
jgi:hypothetical protein